MSDSPPPSLADALASLIPLFERLGLSYCLFGALAVGAWGLPRMTQDVDALLGMENEDRIRLTPELEAAGFHYDRAWSEAIPMIRDFHLRFQCQGVAIDLMLPRDAHDLMALDRRRSLALGSLTVWVIAPDDLVVHKLKVGRAQDLVDAATVLQRQRGNLDMAYIRGWAERLGVIEELEYCLRSSESR